jgi:hypothetical protein
MPMPVPVPMPMLRMTTAAEHGDEWTLHVNLSRPVPPNRPVTHGG